MSVFILATVFRFMPFAVVEKGSKSSCFRVSIRVSVIMRSHAGSIIRH